MSQAPPPKHPISRRRFLRLLTLGALGTATLTGAGVAQAYRFGLTHHRRTLPGLRAPVRVAFLTDLHYGPLISAARVRAWVTATLAQRPDLILLGGDFMDYGHDGPPTPLLNELKRLMAPLGVYGVWGNHDYGSFGKYAGRVGNARPNWAVRRSELAVAFAASGVSILRNQGQAVRDDLYIGGVDDLWHGQPDVSAALAGAGQRATILVSHNPDLLPDLAQPAGLVLCGHTHGGQIRFPLLGAPVVPSRYGQRYAMGWVTGAHDTPAYVSRGLGVSGVPLRNLCEPELTLLTLTGSSPGAGGG